MSTFAPSKKKEEKKEVPRTVAQVFGLRPPQVIQTGLVRPACSNHTLIVGTELETEATPYTIDWYVTNLNQEVWMLERDGSLRPQETSYEFISRPMEASALLAEMGQLFRKTDFQPHCYSDRTSVHIHTNVTDFTQQQIASLALVYTVMEDVIFRFVNHYKAPTEQGYCRDTNLYCIPWTQCRMSFGLVNNIFADPIAAFKNWQKYTALNLLPILSKGTVEWRHMHGTSDMEKLTVWMNIIGSIMLFAKRVEFDDVVKTVMVLNDTSAYRQFFTSVLQGYLPYDEAYQVAMSEGVIHAKYALTNWEKHKGKKPKQAAPANTMNVGINEMLAARVEQQAQILRTNRAFFEEATLVPRPLWDAPAQVRGGVNIVEDWNLPRAAEIAFDEEEEQV